MSFGVFVWPQVDLGGCLSERSWMRGPSQQAGLVDAFLDRILMSIILVRDEVEHKRFAVQPFSLLASNKVRKLKFNLCGSQNLPMNALPEIEQPTMQRQRVDNRA